MALYDSFSNIRSDRRLGLGATIRPMQFVGFDLILDWIVYLGGWLIKTVGDVLQLALSPAGSSDDGSLAGRTELVDPECWSGDFPGWFC